jgi:hypothetical protein
MPLKALGKIGGKHHRIGNPYPRKLIQVFVMGIEHFNFFLKLGPDTDLMLIIGKQYRKAGSPASSADNRYNRHDILPLILSFAIVFRRPFPDSS